ncbi:MAG: glycosyltransferase [Enterococcaceae bacterium]|jgi:rhamnosyltransferase|nr:glycosyltransferase [Enterococcaceae bacterium]MCI1919032.1 glycosyltransferase [Enterococcaceae bacterium]
MIFGIGVIVYNPNVQVLERIKKYHQLTKYVIIFDNSENITNINKRIEAVSDKYYFRAENIGMSGALNQIFKVSIEINLDILLTMDQDSEFDKEEIKKMLYYISKSKEKNIAIFCPNYRKLYKDTYGNPVPGKFSIAQKENKNVSFSMTSGSFMKVSLLEQLLPLSDLFIGYVDHEVCYKLVENNKRILMVGNIFFDQEVGELVNNNLFNRFFRVIHHKKIRYAYMFRNNMYLSDVYKNNKQLRNKLRINRIRLLINILVGENKKIEKIKGCLMGMKLYREGKYGKIEEME